MTDQADAVALANDGHSWPSDTARHAPLQNATFIKACIASGALVPPIGEGAAVRLQDYKIGLFVIVMVTCGLAFAVCAYVWR